MRSKQVRSWMMYDWANSAFATTMLAAVLPIFYQSVAASGLPNHEATSYWAFTQTIGMIFVALLSPILGAMADLSRRKMAFLRVFAISGSAACMLLFFAGNGDWLYVSVLFIFATIGFSGGNTFYDSLLPGIASPEERDDTCMDTSEAACC